MKRVRRKPEAVAMQHIRSATDNFLEAWHINPIKGRGVFALSPFHKGDFVVEYRGEIIDTAEAQARRKRYHPSQAVFMFDLFWHGKQWCIDAAEESGALGRLVNDDHLNPNCRVKKLIADGKPHLVLFALQNINRGDEITYDYGGSDWPWRVDGNSNKELMESSDEVSPSVLQDDGGRSANVSFQKSNKELMESSDEVSPSILQVTKKPMHSLVQYTDSEVSSGPDFSSPQPDTVSGLPSIMYDTILDTSPLHDTLKDLPERLIRKFLLDLKK